jgi:DNA-binding response OmpR family regulator
LLFPKASVGKKILIIDDDPVLLRILRALLTTSNYETVVAADAISGMSAARKEKPDLIILDIGLPGGDGFLLMDRFKKLGPLAFVPVIVLSGRDPQRAREPALQAGAEAFLTKPPDHNELLAAIRKALRVPDESVQTQRPS